MNQRLALSCSCYKRKIRTLEAIERNPFFSWFAHAKYSPFFAIIKLVISVCLVSSQLVTKQELIEACKLWNKWFELRGKKFTRNKQKQTKWSMFWFSLLRSDRYNLSFDRISDKINEIHKLDSNSKHYFNGDRTILSTWIVREHKESDTQRNVKKKIKYNLRFMFCGDAFKWHIITYDDTEPDFM